MSKRPLRLGQHKTNDANIFFHTCKRKVDITRWAPPLLPSYLKTQNLLGIFFFNIQHFFFLLPLPVYLNTKVKETYKRKFNAWKIRINGFTRFFVTDAQEGSNTRCTYILVYVLVCFYALLCVGVVNMATKNIYLVF